MGYHVDGHRNCLDQDIVLAGLDRDAVGVADSEPLLGDLGDQA